MARYLANRNRISGTSLGTTWKTTTRVQRVKKYLSETWRYSSNVQPQKHFEILDTQKLSHREVLQPRSCFSGRTRWNKLLTNISLQMKREASTNTTGSLWIIITPCTITHTLQRQFGGFDSCRLSASFIFFLHLNNDGRGWLGGRWGDVVLKWETRKNNFFSTGPDKWRKIHGHTKNGHKKVSASQSHSGVDVTSKLLPNYY